MNKEYQLPREYRPRYEKVLGAFGDITEQVKDIEKDLKGGHGFEYVKTGMGEVIVFNNRVK